MGGVPLDRQPTASRPQSLRARSVRARFGQTVAREWGVLRVWLDGFEADAAEVADGLRYTFGRAADLVVDPENTQLHRRVGELAEFHGRWVLANVGSRIPLEVFHPGRREADAQPPGQEILLRDGRTIVEFVAGRASYRIVIEVRSLSDGMPPQASPSTADGIETVAPAAGVDLTRMERTTLIALCEPRLRSVGSQYWSVPGNADLARQLNISPRTVEKHVASICQKLSEHGVRDLRPRPGQARGERRRVLVEAAVRDGLVALGDTELASWP